MSTDTLLLERIEALHSKFDRIERRQRMLEDLVDEMTPVVREAMNVASGHLGTLEQKGYFAVANELLGIADRVVAAYGPNEVHQLGDQIVAILDTIRNVTQPDLLALANDATNVLHHADEAKPIGMMGAVRATSDADVQRGLAVAVEVLRHLGRVGHRDASAPRALAVAQKPAARSAAAVAASGAPSAVHCAVPAQAPQASVLWEGVAFSADGFLVDPKDWSPELAQTLGTALGVTVADEHLGVLRWIRDDHAATGASPNVRRVAKGSGVGIERLYVLFPHTPGKTAARLAGVPKPVGCV